MSDELEARRSKANQALIEKYHYHEKRMDESKYRDKRGDEKTTKDLLDQIHASIQEVASALEEERRSSSEATAARNRLDVAKRKLAQLRADLDVVLPDVRT